MPPKLSVTKVYRVIGSHYCVQLMIGLGPSQLERY